MKPKLLFLKLFISFLVCFTGKAQTAPEALLSLLPAVAAINYPRRFGLHTAIDEYANACYPHTSIAQVSFTNSNGYAIFNINMQ